MRTTAFLSGGLPALLAAVHMDRKSNPVENRLKYRGNRVDRRVDRRHGGDR